MSQLNYSRFGSGQPLLLLHGFPLDHSIWRPVVPLLREQFDLILPDLGGFGDSPLPENGASLDEMAASLEQLLSGLGLTRAFVAGHSMGGYLALAFARQSLQMVLGLGLISTQALPDTPERQAIRRETAVAVAEKGVSVVADSMASKLSADSAHASVLRDVILRQPAAGVINALECMAARPDSTNLLTSFDFPVSIIHGLADVLIPIERAQEMKSILPNAQLTQIPNVGHMPMLEAPQETAVALGLLLQL